MVNNILKISITFIWCFFCGSFLLFSQEQQLKLIDILPELEKKYGVSFSYNTIFLENITLNTIEDCNSLDSCLQTIYKAVPITFKKSGENNYLIVPVRKSVSFKVVDPLSEDRISSLNVQVNKDQPTTIYPENEVYKLQNISPLDSIHIEVPFYKSLHYKAQELMDQSQTLFLESKTIFLNEVQVTQYLTKGIDTRISDHSIQVDMKFLKLLVGETDNDILNAIKTIPGMHTPNGKPGNLSLRGSTFDQTLIQIDDIPIYHTGHFYGTLSPYNPSIINHIEVQRNTLPANWGGKVGGLINMTTSNDVPESKDFLVLANTIFAGVTAKMPIIKDKVGFSLAGRSSYPGLNSPKLTTLSNLNFQGSLLESVADNVNSKNLETGFYDINSKLVYDINENNKASISYINIQNYLSAQLEDSEQDNKDFRDLNLDNWGVTLKWDGKFSDKLSAHTRISKSSLIISNTSEGFSASERSSFEKYINTINDTRFISEITYQKNASTSFETGYTFTDYSITFDERIDQNATTNRNDQDATVHSSFLSATKKWDSKITSVFGIHADYYNPKKRVYLDPRLSLSIPAGKNFIIKTSVGRSHQFIQKKLRDDFDDFNNDSQFWYLPDKTTSVLESYQTMLGGLYTKSNWLVDLELYYRKTNNVTLQTSTDTQSSGSLKSLGLDFFVKKRWGKLETLVSYSLSNVNTNFDKVQESIFFDQRHILNITGLLNLDHWNFVCTWAYSSGMPVVIPDYGLGQENQPLEYTSRFPSQHQLDATIAYSFFNTSNKLKSTIGLSLVNIYDQDNIVNIFQNAPSNNSLYRKGIGFSPNLQLSIQF